MMEGAEKQRKPDTPPMQAGDVYEIPVEGSLGLLALGWRGVEAWRKRRVEAIQASGETTTDE